MNPPIPPARRSMGRPTRALVIAVLIGAPTLASCGASGGADEGSSGAPTTTISPLGQLMGWTNDSPEESRRKQLQVEQLVSECMREEGWEYTPIDYAAQDQSDAGPDADLQATDPIAFGEKYGYGVAYYYELYEEDNIGKDGGGFGPAATVNGRGGDDPNAAYVETLSDSEQEEYYASLYGKQQDPQTDEFGSAIAVAVRPEDQGCYGTASAQVYPQNEAANDPDVQERMNDYWQNLQDSPELQAAYEDWADCMKEDVDLVGPTGSTVSVPNDMYTYVDGLKNEAMGLVPEAVTQEDFDKGDGEYYTASMDEDGNGVAWTGEPQPISEADLAELRTTEVKLWKIDHACAETARIAEIQIEAEQKFADELVADFPELAGDDQ